MVERDRDVQSQLDRARAGYEEQLEALRQSVSMALQTTH
jgi:hypothetical protein